LNEPQLPSWNTTLNFPVTEKTYNLAELIDENEELINYDDGLVGFRIEGDLDKIEVDRNLKLDDIEESIELAVSEVDIPRMMVGQLTFAPYMLIPDAADYYDQPRAVTSMPIDDIGVPVTAEDGMVSATISSGTLRLVFDNQLAVPFEISQINLKESEYGAVKLTFTESITMAAKGKGQLDFDLGQTTISTDDYWSVSGTCLGSSGQAVTVNADDSLNIDIELVNLQIESLSAPAGQFVIDQTDSVVIGEAVCIRKATFSEGEITFDVNNDLAFDLNISITSPQFIHRITGAPLSFGLIAKKNQITGTKLPITDYEIEYKGELKKPQCVELQVHAYGEDNGTQISVKRNDTIEFTFAMRHVVINEFTGRLDQFMVGIQPREHQVSIPGNVSDISGLYLDDPKLLIDFYNTLELPLRLEGEMLGRAADGKEQRLIINTDIDAGSLEQETKSSVNFDDSQQKEVKLFASLMPETIVFAGSTFVGHGIAEGMICSESYIRAHYAVETPACFSWNETEFTPDTTFFQINPQGYKGPKLHPEAEMLNAVDMEMLEAFEVDGDIKNHLPISGSLEFFFVTLLPDGTEQELSLHPVKISSAQMDGAGLVTHTWEGKLQVPLGVAGIDILQNQDDEPKLVLLITKMTLHSSGGSKIKVYESDFISLKAAAKLAVGINKE
jgi:hypothetical protein